MKKINKQIENNIVDEHLNGSSIRDIAKITKASKNTVSKYVKEVEDSPWMIQIISQAKDFGVYQTENLRLYRLLSDVREQYDACKKIYEKDGSIPVLTQINKSGEEYKVKNPLVTTMIDLRKQDFDICQKLGFLPDTSNNATDTPQENKLEAILKAINED